MALWLCLFMNYTKTDLITGRKQMGSKFIFFIKNIFKITIMFFIGLFAIRNKKIIIMGQRKPKTKTIKVPNDYFMHNTKYLFLYLNNNSQHDLKIIYLCDDKNMIKELKDKGYRDIYPRKSFKGIYYALRAKYWLYDDSRFSVTFPILSAGAVCINFWHGISYKYIGVSEKYYKLKNWEKRIYKFFYVENDYMIANSDYDANIYIRDWLMNEKNIKKLGSPRLDSLLYEFKNEQIFMEEDYNNIKRFKDSGKKIIIYMPTFRDTGKDISGWLKSDKLKEFLNQNNAVLVCKLHFADKNSLDFQSSEELYKMNSDFDIYPVLKYSDCLVTDYSSIAFDYLLLDKPILYYVPDLKEYQEQCRKLYMGYNDFAAGEIIENEKDLIPALENIANGIDNYKEKRKILRDKMFVYQDGKNCERVMDWIKSLNK